MYKTLKILLLMFAVCFSGLVTADEEYWEYTFRPGDSIWKVAERYTTTVNNWYKILELNRTKEQSDRRILPGTRILVPVSMLKLQPAAGQVVAISGRPKLTRADGSEAQLAIGTLLYSGDRVVTRDKQRLRVEFADKSELQILPDSEIAFDKLSFYEKGGMVDTRIRLNKGSVDTQVEEQKPDSHYEIGTPEAITAVRGTAFRLSSSGDNVTRTEVTEGLVGVSSSDSEKSVKDGYGIVAEKGKPLSEPVKLLLPPEVGANQSSGKSTLQVSWASLSGAEYYRYQLATDEKFNDITVDSKTVNNRVKINKLQPGYYYLRVRGVDQNKLEGLDSVNRFEIKEPAEPSYWSFLVPVGIFLILL